MTKEKESGDGPHQQLSLARVRAMPGSQKERAAACPCSRPAANVLGKWPFPPCTAPLKISISDQSVSQREFEVPGEGFDQRRALPEGVLPHAFAWKTFGKPAHYLRSWPDWIARDSATAWSRFCNRSFLMKCRRFWPRSKPSGGPAREKGRTLTTTACDSTVKHSRSAWTTIRTLWKTPKRRSNSTNSLPNNRPLTSPADRFVKADQSSAVTTRFLDSERRCRLS